VMCVVRHYAQPNPLVNLKFLLHRNTLLLGVVLFFFRFVLLATVVDIPSYLGSVKGFIPQQVGPVLLWVALPQCVCGLIAMFSLRYIDARLLMTFGFGLIAIACLMNAGLTSAWSGANFGPSQAIMALGQAFSFNAMVGAIVLEVLNSGALKRPIDVLTFAAYFQTVRLLGGQMGVALMQRFIAVREQFHSNILGLGVQFGQFATDQRLLGLTAGMRSQSVGPQAAGRAVEILTLQIRQQAYTLAITDAFLLIAWAVVCVFIVIACMAPVDTQYRQVVSA
jgi:MFS transporter, DHA2 family, multidrug resistance protein